MHSTIPQCVGGAAIITRRACCESIVMAGVGAVVSSLLEGKWPLCHDQSFLEPMDTLYLLFKNKGRNASGFNVCFPADRFEFPPLRNLLPDKIPFFEFTPDDFVDSVVSLGVACFVVAIAIAVTKFVWERIDTRFASINPSHKKWYVVANLSKSFILACMCLSPRYWIGSYYAYFLDIADVINMKRCTILYISTDVVALFMVSKLPFSTVLHHITTTSLIMVVSTVNLEIDGYSGLLGVCKMAILYGIFSTFAFLVNAYLALRVVYPNASWLPILVQLSLWPYILFCACNWSIHLIWMGYLVANLEISVVNVVYLLAITTMVNDDIVLIKWLMKRSSPGVREEERK